MIFKPAFEGNLKSLAEKEFFYSSLTMEDFYHDMNESSGPRKTDCPTEKISTEQISTEKISTEKISVETLPLPSVPLIINEQNLKKILEMEQKSDPYKGQISGKGKGFFIPPFYLYYGEEQFIKFVQNNDIGSLCQKYRVVILVGEEELENYFCQLDVVFPTVILGDTDKRIAGKISEVQMEKEKLLRELAAEVFLYYQENGDEIENRVLDGTAKICVLKDSYEPDGFQQYYREFKHSVEKLGYSVFICSERGSIFKTNEIFNLYQYRPDAVFQINKTRTGTYLGEEFQYLQLVENLIYISWLQDEYPTIMSRQCAVSLKKHDYLFSFFVERVMREYGYSDQNVIYGGVMPADSGDFCKHPLTEKEHEAYDCDICFMGSFFSSERMNSWIYGELKDYLTDGQLAKAYAGIDELLGGIYDKNTQKYDTSLKTFNRCLDKTCEELQCDDRIRLRLYKVFDYARYQTLRTLIIRQLAALKKYKIIVYGSYLDIEGIECRGWIKDRKEVSKAIQCSRILMQVNPDTTINKRVAEGILSHTPVVVYEVKEEECQASITHYLEEGEGFFFFNSKQELMEKCDLLLENCKLREETIEKGYLKVSRTLTNDPIFGHLMDSLKEKIRMGKCDGIAAPENPLQEENLRLLSTKEFFYCSLKRQDFYAHRYDPAVVEMSLSADAADRIRKGEIVLFANEQNLEVILKAEQASDFYEGKMDSPQDGYPLAPFYLYYDEEEFIRFIQNNDISSLCRKHRIVILVGPEEFENYFCQLDVMFPAVICKDEDQWIEGKLSEIQSEKRQILGELSAEVYFYYKENGEEIQKRILGGNAKICIIQYYYESDRFRSLYGMFQESVEKLGYQVELCTERGHIFRTDDILKLYQYRPDIVFQINKSRDGRIYQGEGIHYLDKMENLVFINWIQDIHPQMLSSQYARSLKKKDYIFSLFDEKVMEEYGYPKQNVIYRGIMPADRTHFCIHTITEEEHRRFDCDVCFVGTIMGEDAMAAYVYKELEPYLTQEQIARVCDVLLKMREGIYDTETQKYATDTQTLKQYIRRLEEELQCSEEGGGHLYRVFRVVRYNDLRKLVLRHLAAEEKYRIIQYGAYDIQVKGVWYGGMLAEHTELSKAIQCSKILMQVNPDATMNQCVAEGLLSHTPVLVYHVEEEDDMSSIAHYLKEQEGFCYFGGSLELTEKCDLWLSDNKLREEIAERGYNRACEVLTSDAVFGHLMEELKEKETNIR